MPIVKIAPAGSWSKRMPMTKSGIVAGKVLDSLSQPDATTLLDFGTPLGMAKTVKAVFAPAKPETFAAMRSLSKRPQYLTPYSTQELAAFERYLSPDKKVGYALTPEKDLVNVFNVSGTPGKGKLAVKDAIKRGAKTLDCYGGFLEEYYEELGFVPYKREPWNADYAPQGWDYSRGGTPDVVYMKRSGEKK